MKNNKHYAYESPFTMVDSEGVKYTLKVEQDDMPESPRAWDNICSMVCWHSRYDLGDKHNFDDVDEFLQHLYLDVTGKHWCDEHESDDWQDVIKFSWIFCAVILLNPQCVLNPFAVHHCERTFISVMFVVFHINSPP